MNEHFNNEQLFFTSLKLMKKLAAPILQEICLFKAKPSSKVVRVFALKKLKDGSVLVWDSS